MSGNTGRVTISNFSLTQMNKSRYYKKLCFCVLQIRWLATIDLRLSPSKTTCSIFSTSCWVLKSKGTPVMMDNFCFRAHKKLYGSTGLVEFLFATMLRLIARNIGDKVFDSERNLFQKFGITLKTCKMEFA